MGRWSYWLSRLGRRIWFRAAAISLFALVVALASALLAPLVPYELSLRIGSDAVDRILAILASSMLAVTTFSLTAMVTAFSGASSQVTPRATQLLIEDSTAQNALSTFLGGFVFAIVGIVALSTDLYGEQGRAILFFGLIAMIAWIAVTFLRWIQVLTSFGRVPDAIRRVEEAGIAALATLSEPPLLAGKPDCAVPVRGHPLMAGEIGYVGHLDLNRLAAVAEAASTTIHLLATPGYRVGPDRPLLWSDTPLPADLAAEARAAFVIGRDRDFACDARFAMIVLAEIGSRALSPAVNDPGTAIAALDSGERLIAAAAEERPRREPLPALVTLPLSLEELVEDLLLPLMRDGAGLVEVGIRLQHWLGSVAALVPALRPRLHLLADDAVERAREAGMAKTDLDRLRAARDALD